MRVESRTSSCLHLKRAPGIRSWSLLVGILSIGLAAAYYSGDSLGWKLFYVTGCLFVAVQNLEDWETGAREGLAVGVRLWQSWVSSRVSAPASPGPPLEVPCVAGLHTHRPAAG